MKFEWNYSKSLVNKEKHGISFEEAVVIWNDVHMEMKNIARSSGEEIRSAMVGWVRNQLYAVIWTRRKRKIRIISARRARKNEEEIFYKNVQNRR